MVGPLSVEESRVPKHKIGNHLQVKLSGGRIVEATIKAAVETTEGVRLQVSFGAAALIVASTILPPESFTCRCLRFVLPFKYEWPK
jgi:hypothetical protein